MDTSALFAGIWSEGGGGRVLLKLGEADRITLLVSSQVLAELERTVRTKAPQLMSTTALFLAQSNVTVVPAPIEKLIDQCQALIHYDNDALVMAAALQAEAEYFVTLDRKHFLDNAMLRTEMPFPLGTPGDALAWLRSRLVQGRWN
jgi:predicted nucleic acid-binding protein